MKKLMSYFCLAFVVAVLLAIPAVAQKGQGGGRSNRGGNVRGNERAEQIQTENRKGAISPGVENAETKKHKHKDKDAQPDNDKNKGKHKGEQKGKAKGHSK